MSFYPNIPAIRYEGAETNNPFAFRWYNPEEKIGGKTMREQLKFALAYWHTMCAEGSDMFGVGTMDKSYGGGDPMRQAKAKADAAFELMEKLSVDYFCFHDRDIAPEGRTLAESNERLDEIAGTVTKAPVAVLFGWENMWALNDCQGYANVDKAYLQTCYSYHREFWKRGIDCDVVAPGEDLSRYRLVVAPMLYLADDAVCRNLARYVEAGGTLYATYMLGTVDENDLCRLGGFPGGGLGEVFGLMAEEIDTLYPQERQQVAMEGQLHEAADYCEILRLRGARPLAVYQDGWYQGLPAVTEHAWGRGWAVYQACRDTGSLKEAVFDRLLDRLDISSPVKGPLPWGATVHTRRDGEKTYVFAENYSGTDAAELTLEEPMTDMLTGERTEKCTLEPYGFRVFVR